MNCGRWVLLPVLIAVLFASCGFSRYASWQRNKQLVKAGYSELLDTIYITDVILCNSYAKGLWGKVEPGAIREDSVYEHFTSALRRSSLRFSTANNVAFHCDSVFAQSHRNYLMLTIGNDKIEALAERNPNRYKMVPFIRLHTHDMRFISVTASSHSPAGGTKRHQMVGVVVYLFDYEELIYVRMFNYSAVPIDIYTDQKGIVRDVYSEEPVGNTIEQEHWDKLIYKVMKKYLERME